VSAIADELIAELVERIAVKVVERMVEIVPPPNAETWRLLNAKEAGQLLGKSERWVYEACNVDAPSYLRLPYVDVGGVKRFDPESLKRWAQAREIPFVDHR
jgi:hypothetical protein